MNNDESQVFILIDAAHQDFIFCNNEKEYIVGAFGKSCFDHVYKLYQNASDFDKELLTRSFFQQNDSEILNGLRNRLIELYLSDGNFCDFEKRYNLYLDSLQEKIKMISN